MWQAKITKIERDGITVKTTILYTDGTDYFTDIVPEIDVDKDIAGRLRKLNEIETDIETIKDEFLNVTITIVDGEPKIEKEVAPEDPIIPE